MVTKEAGKWGKPLLVSRIKWAWVLGDGKLVASATKKGFAIFRVNDLEGRRNGFHAEVVNASFRLRKIENSRLPAGWACQ
jgi:hypothetical protein